MKPLPLTAPQLAVLLIFAGVAGILGAKAMARMLGASAGDSAQLAQILWMSFDAAALAAVPAFRERARTLLAARVPRARWPEIGWVAVVAVMLQFALFGASALWHWLQLGDAAIRLAEERDLEHAFRASTLRTLALTSLLAPVIEELVFRGFIFEEWARVRRVSTAVLLTSGLFALCHMSFVFPFSTGLLLCAVYMRAGALRAAILVHFVANVAFWYPLLGQYLIPGSSSDIASWWFHLLCLAVVPVFIPVYVFVAVRTRDGASAAPKLRVSIA